jgi:hypothetical protein
MDKRENNKKSMRSKEKHRVKGKHETGDIMCWSIGRLVPQHKLKCLLLCSRCGLSTPWPYNGGPSGGSGQPFQPEVHE